MIEVCSDSKAPVLQRICRSQRAEVELRSRLDLPNLDLKGPIGPDDKLLEREIGNQSLLTEDECQRLELLRISVNDDLPVLLRNPQAAMQIDRSIERPVR